MTSLTCSSRQARTQRVHWMQASRFTAIAGCERSAAGCARAAKRGLPTSSFVAQRSSSESSVYDVSGHVREQQLEHHLLASARARALLVVTSMPVRRIAAAGRREHALALDLDHAGAAVAVGPHAFHVAEARDLDAVLLSAVSMIVSSGAADDRPAVQRERRSASSRAARVRAVASHRASLPSSRAGSTCMTQRPDSAPPGRGRRSTRPSSPATAPRAAAGPTCGCVHQLAAPSPCRRGTACTGRTTRRRRTSSGCAPRRARVS